MLNSEITQIMLNSEISGETEITQIMLNSEITQIMLNSEISGETEILILC